jgi:hypothetical protein
MMNKSVPAWISRPTPGSLILANNRIPFQPGTVKPEAKYQKLAELGMELGIPVMQTFVQLESVGPDEKTHDVYADRSRTLNRNYWNWLFKQFAGFTANAATAPAASIALTADATFGAGHLTNKSTGAVVLNANSTAFATPPTVVALATVGSAATGIVVGTGVAAESFEDVALGAIVAQGTGAGQMSYAAMTEQVPTYNSGTLTWTWQAIRILNNNSGGTITVGEVGIYGASSSGTNYMIMRDKLAATVGVLNAGQLTVTYTFTLTFPA